MKRQMKKKGHHCSDDGVILGVVVKTNKKPTCDIRGEENPYKKIYNKRKRNCA